MAWVWSQHKLGMTVYGCSPRLQRLSWEDQKFKALFSYITSLRPVWAIIGDSILYATHEKQNRNKWETEGKKNTLQTYTSTFRTVTVFWGIADKSNWHIQKKTTGRQDVCVCFLFPGTYARTYHASVNFWVCLPASHFSSWYQENHTFINWNYAQVLPGTAVSYH